MHPFTTEDTEYHRGYNLNLKTLCASVSSVVK